MRGNAAPNCRTLGANSAEATAITNQVMPTGLPTSRAGHPPSTVCRSLELRDAHRPVAPFIASAIFPATKAAAAFTGSDDKWA